MSKKSDFGSILDECLTRLLKGEPVEACLASHPEHSSELEPLLRTALEAREAAVIRPRREFRDRAALEFQAAIREMPGKDAARPAFWRRRWVTALAAVVCVLLAGTGVVNASNSSLPDEPLYTVKLATETVRLALTPSDLGKAELYVKFTDRRVTEIIAMADQGKVQQVDKAAERLDSQMTAMAVLTAPGKAAAAPSYETTKTAPHPMLATPAPSTTTTAAIQSGAAATAPTFTRPPATTTITPTTATVPPPVAITNTPNQDTGLKNIPPPQPPGAERSGGAVPDEQAELRNLLASSAAANSKALNQELAKAPESVRPALERAIEITSTGYEQALSNLN